MEIREEEYTLEFAEECNEMFNDHLNEVKMVSDSPNVDHIAYIRASNRGDLAVIVARVDGKVVGYLIFWIVPSVNEVIIQAQQAGIYLLEEYRKGLNAVKLIRFGEELLKDKYDVSAILLVSTVKKDISPLFRYMKYQEAETTYIKEI